MVVDSKIKSTLNNLDIDDTGTDSKGHRHVLSPGPKYVTFIGGGLAMLGTVLSLVKAHIDLTTSMNSSSRQLLIINILEGGSTLAPGSSGNGGGLLVSTPYQRHDTQLNRMQSVAVEMWDHVVHHILPSAEAVGWRDHLSTYNMNYDMTMNQQKDPKQQHSSPLPWLDSSDKPTVSNWRWDQPEDTKVRTAQITPRLVVPAIWNVIEQLVKAHPGVVAVQLHLGMVATGLIRHNRTVTHVKARYSVTSSASSTSSPSSLAPGMTLIDGSMLEFKVKSDRVILVPGAWITNLLDPWLGLVMRSGAFLICHAGSAVESKWTSEKCATPPPDIVIASRVSTLEHIHNTCQSIEISLCDRSPILTSGILEIKW